MDTTLVAVPSVIDTTAAHAVASQTILALIQALLPDLDPRASTAIAGTLSAALVTGLVFAWRSLIHVMTEGKDFKGFAVIWPRIRGVVNLAIALFGGWAVGGTALTGAAAVVLHQGWKSIQEAAGRRTVEGAKKARHVALILALGLGAMGAAPQAQAWTLLGREVVPSIGVGVAQDIERDGFESASGFGFGQLRWVWSDHLNAGVRVSGDMRTEDGQPFELHAPRLEYSLAWVF